MTADPGEDWQEVAKNSANLAGDSTSEKVEKVEEVVEKQEEESGPTGGSTPGTEIKMPSLSPTMTEGTIVKWLKKVRLAEILWIVSFEMSYGSI